MRLLIIFISVLVSGCAAVKQEFLGCEVRSAGADVSLTERTVGAILTLSCDLWE